MSNHTPGEWAAIKSTGSWDGWLVVPALDLAQKKESGNAICLCYWAQDGFGNAHQDAGANAHLIAAAPVLLAALKCAVAALGQNATYPADVDLARKAATEAVAKVQEAA